MIDKNQLLAEKDIAKRAQKIVELTTKLKLPDLITVKGIIQVRNLSLVLLSSISCIDQKIHLSRESCGNNFYCWQHFFLLQDEPNTAD
jgi:hypothetical protein